MNDNQPRKISTIINQHNSEVQFQKEFQEEEQMQLPIALPRMWKPEQRDTGIMINAMKFYSDLNTMKFPKPRKIEPNLFELDEKHTDLQIIQRLSKKLDGSWNCPEYLEFMHQAYNEVRGLKAAKIKKKNTLAQERRTVQQKELEENYHVLTMST